MFDAVIRNAYIVDGTGNPWFEADIGIKSGKISEIGNLDFEDADRIINAKELMVCPGFIDSHSHADWNIFNPKNIE